MASVIVKFPSGSEVEKQIKTAYRTANGTDCIMFKYPDKKDNENEVFGVTYKTPNSERFEKIVNMEDWKKAKERFVKDLNKQMDDFTYYIPEKEILVTEDFMHDIALRAENSDKLGDHYEEFLKAEQLKEVNIQQGTPIQENVATVKNIIETPIIEESKVVSFPNIQNTNIEPQMQAVKEVSTAPVQENMETFQKEPVISPTIVPEPIPVVQQTNQAPEISAVTKYYVDTMNSLTNQLNEVTEKYIEITKKCQSTVSEIGNKVVGLLEEIHQRDVLSNQTFNQSQQLLMEQEKVEPILSKVA